MYLSLQTNIHMPIKTKNQKEEARAALLRKLELPKSTRAIVVSYIQDERINTWLKGALSALGVVLMTQVDEESIAGADIWITDVFSENIPQSLLCQNRVVGVVPRISNETALCEMLAIRGCSYRMLRLRRHKKLPNLGVYFFMTIFSALSVNRMPSR